MSTKQTDTYPEQPEGAWLCSNPKCDNRFTDYHGGRCPVCEKNGENWSLYKAAPPAAPAKGEPVAQVVFDERWIGNSRVDKCRPQIFPLVDLMKFDQGQKLYAFPADQVMVPREPTTAMILAGSDVALSFDSVDCFASDAEIKDIYRAMLAAHKEGK